VDLGNNTYQPSKNLFAILFHIILESRPIRKQSKESYSI
jgi:hypothetical protein